MEEKNTRNFQSGPVRTRNQRVNKSREKNKMAQPAARNKQRKAYAKKNGHAIANDSDEDVVKVVDKSEYLRRVSNLTGREHSPNVAVDYEEDRDESVRVIRENSNPLGTCAGVGFDDDDGDGTSITSPKQPALVSEDDDFSVTFSGEDDDDSDEDFKADVDDKSGYVFISEYSSSYVSEEDMKCKGKARNTHHGNRDSHVYRRERFQRKSKKSSKKSNVRKNKGVRIEPTSKNSENNENDSFIHSSSAFYYASSEDSGVVRRSKKGSVGMESGVKNDQRKGKSVIVESKPGFSGEDKRDHDEMYLKWLTYEYGITKNEVKSQKKRYHKKFARGKGGKSARENDRPSGDHANCKSGGNKKRGRPRKDN